MIQVLDQQTIDKIAAGEVVERPASIVKELLENAVDSGSNAITVEIKDGGLSLIRVTDKGNGIPKQEVKTAFLRHATSKLATEADLHSIQTLGFRGEALSSIAAVAAVEMITKPPAALTGVRYQIEYGRETGFEEIGAPSGTTVIVRDVFDRIPARKKFLKSNSTEAAHIQEMMEKLALAHPQISFKCMVNGQVRLSTPGNGKLGDVIYSILGKAAYQELLPFERMGSHIALRGMIGRPALSKGNRSGEMFFVNHRSIKSALLTQAVEEAYRPFMMQHRFPVVVLSLDIAPELIDVNVHPRKAEIRFMDEKPVYDFVRFAVSEFLKQQILIPKAVFETETRQPVKRSLGNDQIPPAPETHSREATVSEQPAKQGFVETLKPQPAKQGFVETLKPQPPKQTFAEILNIQRAKQSVSEHIEPFETERLKKQLEEQPLVAEEGNYRAVPQPRQHTVFEQTAAKKNKYFRLIGQLFQTYWLLELEDSAHLYLLDQHAVHEKILFERTMKQISAKQPASQGLLPAQTMTFTPSEQDLLEQYHEAFTCVGFELEPFEGNEYLLRSVPADLFDLDYREILHSMLEAIQKDGRTEQLAVILEKVASISCKAAIKGNRRYSETEITQMVRELLELDNPFFCPHGRPTMVELTKTELEKKFKRIV